MTLIELAEHDLKSAEISLGRALKKPNATDTEIENLRTRVRNRRYILALVTAHTNELKQARIKPTDCRTCKHDSCHGRRCSECAQHVNESKISHDGDRIHCLCLEVNDGEECPYYERIT